MGKYIQMSRLLKSIAYQIITCMNQLFDYYLYSVHLFFASDLVNSYKQVNKLVIISFFLSERFKYYFIYKGTEFYVKKIQDNLILNEQEENIEGKVYGPSLSPLVDLKNNEQLNGLAERIIAVESLIFLAKQYEYLQDYLEYLIPQTNKIMLQQFYTQVSTPFFILKNYFICI